MENRRIRLHFADRDILTASQRKEGLSRSWVLLKPNLKSIADLARYVIRLFRIDESCPDGILLYIDGFVLPEFESTAIVKDKDLICVKRRIGVGDRSEFLEVEGTVARRDLSVDNKLLLANEEFENEIGGYQSEEEEDEGMEEEIQESRKRKADRKRKSPQRKKKRRRAEKVTKSVVEDCEIDTHVLKECKVEGCKLPIKKAENDQQQECSTPTKLKSVKRETRFNGSNETMGTKTQAKEGCSQDTPQLPGDRTKGSSRSARRKKAKRRWLREKSKLENELKQKQSIEKDHKELAEESSDESSEESSEEGSKEVVMKDEGLTITKQQQQLDDEDVDDEVIPVEIRPGHIRFESRSKGDVSDHDVRPQTQNPVETFNWNGITNKKKGQKWGSAKDTNRSWNDNIHHRQTSRMTTSNDSTPERCTLDFEKLEPYVGLPKKGDVMAYRLMELSSSWCPEVSSFRVGKVSSYDPESNVIRLESVPEYPLAIEKNQEQDEEEDCVPESDPSLYDIDGSLEVEFSTIVDPRVVKRATMESSEVAATKTKRADGEKDARSNNGPPHTEKKTANEAAANTWDEVIQVLSAKKLELSAKENGDEKKQNSGKSPWSYRAMRGSALGPIMARLREQNELEGK